MKNILLIQSRVHPEIVRAEREEFRRALPPDARLSVRSALEGVDDWEHPVRVAEGFSALIFGGSGEFDLHGGRAEDDEARVTARRILARVRPLIDHALEAGLPMLGVCFGHQLIAETYGGAVRRDEMQKKSGSHEVRRSEHAAADPIFSDLPETFLAQYGHKDSATSLPEGATLLASGKACRFAALRYGARAYTTQFHPELGREDMLKRFSKNASYLPPGADVAAIVKESPEASRIIPLFVERVVR